MSNGTASSTVVTFAPDELVRSVDETLDEKATLASGQKLTRGAVLGRITASGKYTLAASAAGDGSSAAVRILGADCDASGGDAECLVYRKGTFGSRALNFGTGHSATTVAATLVAVGIFLVDSQPAL
jgi:hypothetical protein